jgi:hypothetical protein
LLQTALHTKAKNSPDYRFYALYDKVHRRDVLAFAYVRRLNNGGVPGVDGQSFDDIEKGGFAGSGPVSGFRRGGRLREVVKDASLIVTEMWRRRTTARVFIRVRRMQGG